MRVITGIVRQWLGVGALIVVAVGGMFWFGRSGPKGDLPTTVAANAPVVEQTVTIHVAGEVRSPGLVQVGESARVADVVAAAGGSTRRADLSGVNLAAPVRDGEQVVIPRIDDDSGGDSGAVASDGRVRINVASAGELESLPGVGPVLAGRIAAYRDEHGPFEAVEDLLSVPGIGEGKLATLRDSVLLP